MLVETFKYSYCSLVELEQKTKLTNYWPVYELVDDVTTTSYHSNIPVYCLNYVSLCLFH